jgi:hypothetical protein
MDTQELDQGADLRLGAAQRDRAAAGPQAPGEDRQVEHQRGIGEDQLGEIDDDIGLRADRPRDGAPP